MRGLGGAWGRGLRSMGFKPKGLPKNFDDFTKEALEDNPKLIDELIDSGMDTMGVEASMAVLKKMSRERNKNVFLVSHKDELQSRVTDILQVTKENGFTTYETTKDFVLE